MKHLLNKATFIFLLFFSFILVSQAQLRFPNGIVLNFHTNINIGILKPRYFFYTGPKSVDNYKWEKISDSIDTRWLISSCFNVIAVTDYPKPETSLNRLELMIQQDLFVFMLKHMKPMENL